MTETMERDATCVARTEPYRSDQFTNSLHDSFTAAPEKLINLDDRKVAASFAHFCPATGMPEQLLVDYVFFPQPFKAPTVPVALGLRGVGEVAPQAKAARFVEAQLGGTYFPGQFIRVETGECRERIIAMRIALTDDRGLAVELSAARSSSSHG